MLNNPIEIGKKFLVIPSGFMAQINPGILPIWIEPSHVFGSGTHPTTQLCLQVLERHLVPGSSLLDIGTGTGILSIAAALLGAKPIKAVDIDIQAIETTQRNIGLNILDERICVEKRSIVDLVSPQNIDHKWANIIINISLPEILKFLESNLANLIHSGSLLFLAGFLRSQSHAVRARLNWKDLELLAMESIEEWVCMIARKN